MTVPEPDERELIERARRGDQAALDALCRRDWDRVFAFVAARVRDRAAAEDLTQEVYARTIRSLPHFEVSDVPFRAYLIQVARNLIRDRWRNQQRRAAIDPSVPILGSAPPDPEVSLAAAVDRDALMGALRRLPPEVVEVLRLRVFEGLSAAEVGARTGRTAAAVRQIQHRGIAQLRQFLQGEVTGDE